MSIKHSVVNQFQSRVAFVCITNIWGSITSVGVVIQFKFRFPRLIINEHQMCVCAEGGGGGGGAIARLQTASFQANVLTISLIMSNDRTLPLVGLIVKSNLPDVIRLHQKHYIISNTTFEETKKYNAIKFYEQLRLPRIRPLRCDYFNLSENPCL